MRNIIIISMILFLSVNLFARNINELSSSNKEKFQNVMVNIYCLICTGPMDFYVSKAPLAMAIRQDVLSYIVHKKTYNEIFQYLEIDYKDVVIEKSKIMKDESDKLIKIFSLLSIIFIIFLLLLYKYRKGKA